MGAVNRQRWEGKVSDYIYALRSFVLVSVSDRRDRLGRIIRCQGRSNYLGILANKEFSSDKDVCFIFPSLVTGWNGSKRVNDDYVNAAVKKRN